MLNGTYCGEPIAWCIPLLSFAYIKITMPLEHVLNLIDTSLNV
jgi:hypothetical protein